MQIASFVSPVLATHGQAHSPAAQQCQIHSSTPAVLGYEGLAQLLQRSPLSLQADFSRKPASLPPAHKPPGTKNPLWILSEVLDWLAAQPTKAAAPAPACLPSARAAAAARRRGRPTKAEQIARQRALEGGA